MVETFLLRAEAFLLGDFMHAMAYLLLAYLLIRWEPRRPSKPKSEVELWLEQQHRPDRDIKWEREVTRRMTEKLPPRA